MNDRLENHRNVNNHFTSLKRNPSLSTLENAILQLEDCVKHGQMFQASHLSDWITFVAFDVLRENRHCHQRVRIERLKRLGYLHFFEEERACRDELCESENVCRYLDLAPNPIDDETRWRLGSAIGHTLWHERDLKHYRKNFATYKKLCLGLTELFSGRTQTLAFLLGLEGRLAFLEGRDVTITLTKFEEAFALLTEHQRRTRVGLHLINEYLYHLLDLYVDPQPENVRQQLSKRIDDLLFEFDNRRTGTTTPTRDSGQQRPLRTLLQIHVGLHQLRKLKVDIGRLQQSRQDASRQQAKFAAVQGELLFTAAMLGLGSLNPCPPLLREVYKACAVEGEGFDSNQAKNKLKSYLLETTWQAFEEIAIVYFRHLGGNVEQLPSGEATFDLLVETSTSELLLHAATLIGVQVKHERKDFPVTKFRDWQNLAREFRRRRDISRVIFFLQCNPNVNLNRSRDHNREIFPALQGDIEFWNVDKITELLWQNYGCLPEVYGVLEHWRKEPVPAGASGYAEP